MLEGFDSDQWYWDRRTRKALYPERIDDETVRFTTVWHAEEVEDALEGEALVPLNNIGLESTDTTFDLVESFRTPADIGASGDDAGENAENGDQ